MLTVSGTHEQGEGRVCGSAKHAKRACPASPPRHGAGASPRTPRMVHFLQSEKHSFGTLFETGASELTEKTASAELTRFLDFRFSGLRLHCLLLFFSSRLGRVPMLTRFCAANWRVSHLSVSGRRTEQSDPRAPHANSRFRIHQSSRISRGLQVTSAARRIASGSPSFHFRRARTRWRTFVTCRRSPSPRPRWRARRGGAPRCRTRRTSPSARSEGCWRRAFRVRLAHGRACASIARLPSPPPSRTHPFFCRLEHLRASGSVAPPEDVRDAVHASTPSFKKRSTIEAFDAAQNALDFLL